MHLFT